MIIENDKLVSLTYQLKSDNANGEIIEIVTADNPLTFLFGQGMMLPKFEENIQGKKVGESFEFILDSTDAYGEYSEDNVIEIPSSVFELDKPENRNLVKVGNSIPMMDSAGNRLTGVVLKIEKDFVTMDFNHAMAGKQLYFTGKVVSVKEPSDEDLMMFNTGCSGCGGGDCSSGGCH
ncbi:MAG TPA: FKBP-type peptidyl-prolyl cis-trans isomerase [Salinivirgaceae bacterium]|nr:FKBP-type peptidyl-prolyl cis-trans isomerase [Salinivirgaceae bacterium]